jgi:hypothetical protein
LQYALLEGIGWDVVTMLAPFVGMRKTTLSAIMVLNVVATMGNAKEVFLKCVEVLEVIKWDEIYDTDSEEDEDGEEDEPERGKKDNEDNQREHGEDLENHEYQYTYLDNPPRVVRYKLGDLDKDEGEVIAKAEVVPRFTSEDDDGDEHEHEGEDVVESESEDESDSDGRGDDEPPDKAEGETEHKNETQNQEDTLTRDTAEIDVGGTYSDPFRKTIYYYFASMKGCPSGF